MFALSPRLRGAAVMVVASALAACNNSTEPRPGTSEPSALAIVSGNGQVGLTGQVLSVPLVVKATANGSAVRGASVSFAVTSGTASVAPATATTDTAGQAKTVVTLGLSPGPVTITATVTGTALTATFVQTIGSGTLTQACSSSAATTPAAGGVLSGISGTGICLGGGGSGAEYALVAFYGNTDNTTSQTFTVTGKGATAVTSASSTIASADVATTSASLIRLAPSSGRAAFDRKLRETARRDLTPRMTEARAGQKQLTASFSAIPSNPTVGSFVTLNTNADQACTGVRNRIARVAAVSNVAIVVADTANPSGGFTDAEYQSFATMFDTLINPLAVANFGTPSDVDRNSKIVIFFTKEVNALTPRTGSAGTIGGFFFERDLFPLTTQNGLQGCPGSNYAEMFYVLVPDPLGVYSRPQSKSDVLNLTPGTIAHEFQHLINAGRRLYVNDAANFEEVWLNEGLSHIAEELIYYKVAGLAPRQNIGSFTTQAAVNAFNHYQLDNNGRYEIFLGKPNQTSVYANNDLLESRGATWNLLRYLADHRGDNDGDAWRSLVNTTLTGQQNLARVFGANYLTMIGDWATSVFADDVPGMTDTRFVQPSWNMRAIFPKLVDSNGRPLGRFPLAVTPLSETAPANLSVQAGGAAYLRFSVAAGGQASIDWSASGLPVSGLMRFTVVRTK